jgi:glutathione S-transferase
MEKHLASHDFLVGKRCSIADVSLFAYTHVAHEGGFDLSAYPAILRWISTIKSLPGYVSMPPASSRQTANP